jgi:hypothetical protein
LKVNKLWLFSIILTAVLFSTVTYALVQTSVYTHRSPQFSANVFVIVETVNGRTEIPAGNVLTNLFETNLRNTYGFYNDTVCPNATNMTKYISVGNCTPAQTLTIVTTEANENGFARALGTVSAWANGTDAAFNVTKTFTCTTAAENINSAGLNWFATAASDGNLVAVAAITATTFAIGDNCTITWVITFDAN